MAFKMRCPKCNGTDYSIERDNRTFGAVAQAFELVFHCRCGKQMFGEQILKLYDEQKKEYESAAGSRAEVEAEVQQVRARQEQSEERLNEALEYRRRFEQEKRRQEEEAARAKKEEEDRRWREKVKHASTDDEDTLDDADEDTELDDETDDDGETCAWNGCSKQRRKNSKYCSRACSNKNARHRHKQRRRRGGKSREGDSAAA